MSVCLPVSLPVCLPACWSYCLSDCLPPPFSIFLPLKASTIYQSAPDFCLYLHHNVRHEKKNYEGIKWEKWRRTKWHFLLGRLSCRQQRRHRLFNFSHAPICQHDDTGKNLDSGALGAKIRVAILRRSGKSPTAHESTRYLDRQLGMWKCDPLTWKRRASGILFWRS